MSRRSERCASRGKGRYYPGLWEDILITWATYPKPFHQGVGQSTLAYFVRQATGKTYPSHHIRRQIKYAINAGFVRYLRDDEFLDEYRPTHNCTRFKLLKNQPLPKPGEPLVQNFADIVESNGRTIRQNKMAQTHKIPLGTLVKIPVTDENRYCFGKYEGTRLFVVQHNRDCDGEPLYALSPNKDLFKDVNMNSNRERLWARMNIVDGITESDLRVVDLERNKWPHVPPVGTYVIFNHPITPLNPSLIFRVHEICSESGKVSVRGKNTCWIVVNECSLRAPTPEEAADLNNYHPDEL
jgi:hypothetical protein